jgi:copper chaperone CopZ
MAVLDRYPITFSFFRRIALVLASVTSLLAPTGYVFAAGTLTAATASQTALKTVVIPVDGMACVACVATVKSAIKSLAGVSHVEVSLEKHGAQVTYEPNKLSPDTIVAAINKVGYKAGSPREAQ